MLRVLTDRGRITMVVILVCASTRRGTRLSPNVREESPMLYVDADVLRGFGLPALEPRHTSSRVKNPESRQTKLSRDTQAALLR